jgi:predicted transcriptional regulator
MVVVIYIHHHQSILQHTSPTNLVKMVHEYRDRVYIRKDVILKLSEYGELNQTKLMSYCGLNNVKHRGIIDDMVDKGLIERFEEPWGNKTIIKYKVSEKGRAILQAILEPYEVLFPRSEGENKT